MNRRVLLAAAVAALLAAGCGRQGLPVPLHAAPEPALSPPAAARLPGQIEALPGKPEGVVVDAAGEVAVAVRDPGGVVLFPIADPGHRHFVGLPGEARHLALAGPDGPLIVPDEGADVIDELDLPGGRIVERVGVGDHPHNAAELADGTVFVADELANTVDVVQAGRVVRTVAAPLQPGGVAASGSGQQAVVVGVRGRDIEEYGRSGQEVGIAACGAGPTHVVTGDDGIFWVADTIGGRILGFVLDRHGPHQVASYAVGPRPYGLAMDRERDTLWVTDTGDDRLVGLHLRGTTVTSRTSVDTVRQPNTVAVDESTGQLVVTGSAAPGQLQILADPG